MTKNVSLPKRALSLLLAVIMVMCLVPFANPPVNAAEVGISEGAANNSYDTAKQISVNTSYTDNLSTSSEQDYYKFSLSSSAKVAVNFNHTYIDYSYTYWVVRIYDSSYQELLEFNVKGDSINSVSASTGLASGSYFVKISAYNFNSMNYTFSINSTTSDYWEKEYNNDYSHASYVSVNNKYSGSLMRSNDVDFYYFNITSPSKVSIAFNHEFFENSWSYWVIDVYTEELKLIENYSVPGNKASITMPSIGLPAGKYYIKIYDYNFNSMDYSFTVGCTVSDYWEKEINDDFYSPSAMSVNYEYHGSLGNDTDKDYYKFSLSSNSKINIVFKHDSIDSSWTYFILYLYDSSFSQIMNLSIRGNETVITSSNIGLPSGDYYIKVDKNNYTGIDYSIKVNSSTVSNWETERNNDYNSGDIITFNVPYYGSICDSSDTDYYKFSLSSTSSVSFYFEHDYIDSSWSYWTIGLYDTNGNRKLDASARGNQTLTTSSSVSLPAGNYYLKISPNNYNGQDYCFMVDGPETAHTTHTYGSWTTTKSATCTASGTKTRTCTVCGATETQTISATGHSYGSWTTTKSATCTASGTKTRTCSACGNKETETIAATGHSYGSWTTTKSATCTASGTKTRTCSACGNKETETIAATGHKYTTKVVAPTTTERGYTLYTCSVCGDSYRDNYTDALTPVTPVTPTDPTAPQITVANKTAGLGSKVDVDISLKNNPGIVGMTLDVKYDSTVLKLIEVKDKGVLGANSHKPELRSPYTLSWSNDTSTTNYVVNGAIVTLVFEVSDVAPEGQYPISITYDYDNMDIYNKDIDKVKFEIVNGAVNVTKTLCGDVNNDGKVNNLDRVYITRYLAKWDEYQDINLSAADVNLDGNVNNLDKVILTRYLAKWDEYSTLPYNK